MANKIVIDWKLFQKMVNEDDYPYKVEEEYCNLLAHKVSKDTGISIGNQGRYDYYIYSDTSKRIECNKITSYDDLVDWVESQIGGQSGKDKSWLKNYFSYPMSNLWLKDKVGELSMTGSSFVDGIFGLLIYAISDGDINAVKNISSYKFMEKAQKISDEHATDDIATLFYPTHGLRFQKRYGEWIDMGTMVDKVFDGLKIKFYQNSKVQIKGLTESEWEYIKYIKQICMER